MKFLLPLGSFVSNEDSTFKFHKPRAQDVNNFIEALKKKGFPKDKIEETPDGYTITTEGTLLHCTGRELRFQGVVLIYLDNGYRFDINTENLATLPDLSLTVDSEHKNRCNLFITKLVERIKKEIPRTFDDYLIESPGRYDDKTCLKIGEIFDTTFEETELLQEADKKYLKASKSRDSLIKSLIEQLDTFYSARRKGIKDDLTNFDQHLATLNTIPTKEASKIHSVVKTLHSELCAARDTYYKSRMNVNNNKEESNQKFFDDCTAAIDKACPHLETYSAKFANWLTGILNVLRSFVRLAPVEKPKSALNCADKIKQSYSLFKPNPPDVKAEVPMANTLQ